MKSIKQVFILNQFLTNASGILKCSNISEKRVLLFYLCNEPCLLFMSDVFSYKTLQETKYLFIKYFFIKCFYSNAPLVPVLKIMTETIKRKSIIDKTFYVMKESAVSRKQRSGCSGYSKDTSAHSSLRPLTSSM